MPMTTVESLDALADATAVARQFRLAWDEARATAAALELAFRQAEQRLVGLARQVAGCEPADDIVLGPQHFIPHDELAPAPVPLAGDPEPMLAEMRERVAASAAKPAVPAEEVFAEIAARVPAFDTEADLDRGLRAALAAAESPDVAFSWTKSVSEVRAGGATDRYLLGQISSAFGKGGTAVTDPGGTPYHWAPRTDGPNTPAFWYGVTVPSGAPTLAGETLLHRVRNLYAILTKEEWKALPNTHEAVAAAVAGEPVEGPSWRNLTLEAAGYMAGEDAFEPEVCEALVAANVRTCGELADRLLAGETFDLPLVDLETVYAAIEMISEDDERPIDFDAHFASKKPVEVEPPVAPGSVVRTSYGTGPYVVKLVSHPQRPGELWGLTLHDAHPAGGKQNGASHINHVERHPDGRVTSLNGRDELCVLPPGSDPGPTFFDWLRPAGLVRENGNKDLQRQWMRGDPVPVLAPSEPEPAVGGPIVHCAKCKATYDATGRDRCPSCGREHSVTGVPVSAPKKAKKSGAKVTKVMLANGPATIVSHPDAVVPGEPIPSYEVGAKPAPACASVGRCRLCGCVEENCARCIERTGLPCSWASPAKDLCTACLPLLEADYSVLFVGFDAIPDRGTGTKLGAAMVRTIGHVLALDPAKPPKGFKREKVEELKHAAERWVEKQLAPAPVEPAPAAEPVTALLDIDNFPDAVADKLFPAITTLPTLLERVEYASQLLGDMPLRNKLVTFFVDAGVKMRPAEHAADAVAEHVARSGRAAAEVIAATCSPWRDRTLVEAGVTEGPAAWGKGTLQQLAKAGVETFGQLADKFRAGETFLLLREPLREMCDAVEALSSGDAEPITFADVPRPIFEAEPKSEPAPKPEPTKKPKPATDEKPYGWDITYTTNDGQELRCHYTGTETKARRRAMQRPKAKHVIKCEPLSEKDYAATFGRGGM